jgi:enoyl-CoA hydratase
VTEPEDPFLVSRHDNVTTIAFNRPSRANAFPQAVWDTFPAVLGAADRDPESNAIVLTGTGRFFCTGGDVDAMAVHKPTIRIRHQGLDLVDALLTVEKPIVALVNGAAIGLGATIALLCDCVVMAEQAVLADTHVPLGIVAGDGALVALTLLVGPHRAKELAIVGRRLRGTDAFALGLVNRCVPAERLEAEGYGLAAELAAQPPHAVRATKLAINQHLRVVASQMLEVAFAYEKISMDLPEHKEALDRFQVRNAARRSAGPSESK